MYEEDSALWKSPLLSGRPEVVTTQMSIVLSCPSCSTSYRADPQAIGSNGRRVRCASCGYVWSAKVEDPEQLPDLQPAQLEEDTPEVVEEPKKPHEAYRERQAKKRQTMSAAVAGGAWGGLAIAVALLLACAWVFRVDVVTAFPRASSAYAAVGTTVNPFGISVGELHVSHQIEHGVPLLVVEGDLHNYDRRSRPVPEVRAVLRDGHGQSLLEWSVQLDVHDLQAGDHQAFRTIVSDPPPATVEVEVILVDAITSHLEESGHDDADEGASHEASAQEHH